MFDGALPDAMLMFVAPRDLVSWADRIRPHVVKMAAGSGGRYEAADIFAALVTGSMLLWVVLDGSAILCVCIGQVQNFPRLRTMRIIGLVGHRPRKWRHFLPALEDQARRDFGCDVMESLHMPRFLALLPGFRTSHWLSEKRL